MYLLKVLSQQRNTISSEVTSSSPQSYLFNSSTNIWKPWCLDTHFIPNNSDFVWLIKTTIVVISRIRVNPSGAEIFLNKQWRSKVFFQFDILINILVSFFRSIWIPMLWVYGQSKYFYFYSAGIVFSRQNLPSRDVRFWRLKSIPAL